ncbi:TetR/AcrR family transcriptional regulator [[Actinomadura] parvosata]|uniref:TetR/AcrR family transcriptional regulator n=1 Tax=[Actinomadura] parvosata TaxID=1955412 RepID=UPI001648622E|nr:TetR/AcrR family transcriptional regulator [Nonomuraea sp. ATCC 55076]
MNGAADEPFEELIERSSLGAPGARQLRQRTPQPKTDELRRIQEQRARRYVGLSAEQRLADRRERLLTAAYTLFAKPGFHATTIERLCSEARISSRAFYECFSGRERLLQSLYERVVDDVLTQVTKAMEEATAPEAQFVDGITRYIHFTIADWRRARIMHVEAAQTSSIEEARRQALRRFAEVFHRVVTNLPGGRSRDPYLYALGVHGVLHELICEWLEAEKSPPTEVLVGTVVDIFLGSARTAR